ncbi:DMT family transporter [Neptunicoccus sediminis]|uniref:DMT family transporter n=1 Tax=Neptunicoccus sediminis TaxID=1892596 RepID=UPI001FDF66B2|nr:DMT family transporter [Neptunicoccus sediminis]
MKQIAHRMTLLEWSMLAGLSIVWGGSFFFAAVAIDELPAMTIAFIRVFGGALILVLALRLLRIKLPRSKTVWLALLGMGLMNNAIPFSLIFWAQNELASGVASILNAMTPIFTVIAAHFLTDDEHLSGGRIIGLLLGFAGVFILMGGNSGESGAILPHIAVLGAGVSYALASIFGKRFGRLGVAPLATATGQVCASSLLLLPVVLMVDQPWTYGWPSGGTLWALAGLVVLSTAVGYFLYFRILSTAGATNLALVTFLIPPSAILLGVLVLNESLGWNHIAGMAVIGAGLAAIDGRVFGLFKQNQRRTAP